MPDFNDMTRLWWNTTSLSMRKDVLTKLRLSISYYDITEFRDLPFGVRSAIIDLARREYERSNLIDLDQTIIWKSKED